jgi:light-regulated signal transduction histidine kinase (bacteriophytochrome)
MLMPDKYAVHHDQYLNNYQTTHDAKMIGIGREVEGKKKNGDIFPLDLSVTEIKIDDAVFYSGVVRDISERKKAEDALKASNEALLKSNAELDDFAYIASHDLKEPLRAIYNHSRFLMEDHGDTLSSDAVSRLSSLLDASKRMDKLIDDLLNFSRLSRSEVSQVEVDMNEVVQDVVRNISAYLEECNGKVIIGQYLPPVVCDEVRAFSIFHNLIINAMKYNDHQEKIVNIGYKAEHVHDGTLVKDVYFVKDNGIGIDEKFKESVFRIFKRLNSSTAYGEGSGAGLTFTKKNVERHGGIIWFESVKGQGTVFYFTLKNAQD